MAEHALEQCPECKTVPQHGSCVCDEQIVTDLKAQVAELEATKRTLNSMLSCAITKAHCPHCSTPMDATAMTGVYECGKCIEDYGGVSIRMQEAKAKEV